MADKKFLSSFLVLWFLAGNHSAAAETLEDGFYSRSSEGWFFYNEEQEPEEEETEQEEPVMAEIPAPEPTVQEPETSQPKTKLVVGSAAWLKANLPIYLNQAIDNPTEENINAYLFLQKMSMDKANRFSNAYSLAVVGHPLYDDSLEQSGTYAVNRMKEQESKEATKNIFEDLSSRTSILFVFDNTPFSLFQAKVVKRFSSQFNFMVVAVLSDDPNPDMMQEISATFPNVVIKPGIAKELHANTLPASFLVTGDRIIPFLFGGAADSEFSTRIAKVAYREKLITEEQFRKTRILDVDEKKSLADVDISKASNIKNAVPEFVTGFGDNTVNYVDPKVIVELMEQAKQSK
ncbi:conjugal transfer protein TraF [Ruminobacter sp.]|uniref:conjugal transfer protein TraF n=1 Tax=Ruminobacter sp. TaxID=2774296 RepID=UPI003862DB6D